MMLEDLFRQSRDRYYTLPQWQKRIVGRLYNCVPTQVKLGQRYQDFVDLIRRSEFMSRAELDELQFDLLKRTLTIAHRYVPYYQRTFAEYGVTPATLTCLGDLSKFPVLTKRDIQNHFSELTAVNVPQWKHLVTYTGGSTSAPLKVVHEKGNTRSKERAFIWDGWSRAGYFPGAKTVQLKGRAVGNPANGTFWEYEPIQNYLEMDGNYLTRDNIPKYLDEIRRFGPQFLLGYPSSVYLLALFLKENPRRNPFHGLKAVLLASEQVYDWQRVMFEEVFGCRVFSHYGHSEMVLLGMENEQSHDLLFYPQYGFLEMLDENSTPETKQGGYGELLGTSFHNEVMPLIRYRVEGYGTVGAGCDAAGRHYPTLQRVEGRLQEFIVTEDCRLISICNMGAAHFDISQYVYEIQYYQDAPGRLEFRVVPREGYGAIHRGAIRHALHKKLGHAVKLEIKELPRLEKSRSGKHIMMIQRLPIDEFVQGAGPQPQPSLVRRRA